MEINANTTLGHNGKTFTVAELIWAIDLVSNYCIPTNCTAPNLILARTVLMNLLEDEVMNPPIDKIGWITKLANMVSYATATEMLGTWKMGDGFTMFDGLQEEIDGVEFDFETTEDMVIRILNENLV